MARASRFRCASVRSSRRKPPFEAPGARFSGEKDLAPVARAPVGERVVRLWDRDSPLHPTSSRAIRGDFASRPSSRVPYRWKETEAVDLPPGKAPEPSRSFAPPSPLPLIRALPAISSPKDRRFSQIGRLARRASVSGPELALRQVSNDPIDRERTGTTIRCEGNQGCGPRHSEGLGKGSCMQ